jgi:chemotaxis response regulator CheB
MMLQDHLAERGYATADIALTQSEAIAFAERHCPDIITADDRLDDGSGVEAIRHICRVRPIPVIFIVAVPDNVQKVLPDALTLQKPFSEAALNKAIREAKARPFALCLNPLGRPIAK